MTEKANQIKKYLLEGKSSLEIQKELNVSKSTISYHAGNLGLKKFSFKKKDYDWKAIQDYHNLGNSLKEICKYFEISKKTLRDGRLNGNFLFQKEEKIPKKKEKIVKEIKERFSKIIIKDSNNSEIEIDLSLYKIDDIIPVIHGPYTFTDGTYRKFVILFYSKDLKKTKSFARFLMETHLNRFLDKDEHVDHIDGDCKNDCLENLQILTPRENNQKAIVQNNITTKIWEGNCPNCGIFFSKPLSRVRSNLKLHKEGPFCSKHCAGQYTYVKPTKSGGGKNSGRKRTHDYDLILSIHKNEGFRGLAEHFQIPVDKARHLYYGVKKRNDKCPSTQTGKAA